MHQIIIYPKRVTCSAVTSAAIPRFEIWLKTNNSVVLPFLPRLLSLHYADQRLQFSFSSVFPSYPSPVTSNTIKHLTADDRTIFFTLLWQQRSDSDLVKWPCSSLRLLKGLRFHLLFSQVDLVWCYCFIHKIAFTNVKGLTEALTWAFSLIQCSLCLSKFMRYTDVHTNKDNNVLTLYIYARLGLLNIYRNLCVR